MPGLEYVHLINAAGFGEVKIPVGGHCRLFSPGNGDGKTTLLRAVLFFYLGNNDKASYALDENKKDFVSYYLGIPPSYLIYCVARTKGQPDYHIVVTRPGSRIQFHFVDAPFARDYYFDGNVVLPIERVQERWRDARCPNDLLSSYEDFTDRIYGIERSAFGVFRPAARGAGQVSVLPRIISGIFTVNQIDADKLKSALTCGLRNDAVAAELDLAQLKNQLEHFRRVNLAVKTYLRHEQEAENLVELATSFEMARADRQRAIENLVRAAKRLPEESQRLDNECERLRREEAEEAQEFEREIRVLNEAIKSLGNDIAVLDADIQKATHFSVEYVAREIERKARELELLPQCEEEQRMAEGEYLTVTAKFADENQRKEQLLASVRQGWVEVASHFQKRRMETGEKFRAQVATADSENETARAKVVHEQESSALAFKPRRKRLDDERTALSDAFKSLADMVPPREIAETEAQFHKADREQREQSAKQDRIRREIEIAREKAKAERQNFNRDAEEEKTGIEATIQTLDGRCSRATAELDAFDVSLARFFQEKSPDSWPDAAKTLNRDTLFKNAGELSAKLASDTQQTVWGIEISTAQLPDSAADFDRARLAGVQRDLRKQLKDRQEALAAAKTRYIAAFDAQEKRHAETSAVLESSLAASVELVGKLGDEAVRLENHLVNLRTQFDAKKRQQRETLDAQECEWKKSDDKLCSEERGAEEHFRSLLTTIEAAWKAQRTKLIEAEKAVLAGIDGDEETARKKHEAEMSRIKQESQRALSEKGVNAERVTAAQKRVDTAAKEVKRIGGFRDEVAEYRGKKSDWIDRLPSWESKRATFGELQEAKQKVLAQLGERHQLACSAFCGRANALKEAIDTAKEDQKAVTRFQNDPRFEREQGCFHRDDLPPASFHQPGAISSFLSHAETAHQSGESIGKQGNQKARDFLKRFEDDGLKLLGFSPLHEHFDWFFFVGDQLKRFVHNQAISGMKRLQTQQFEQFIHNICNKNAAFADGIRQVNQTADSVQANLATINFVEVLDSVELKVERKDNQLISILEGFAKFEGLSFREERDLFAKGADRTEIDRAIDHFERLLRQIDSHRSQHLLLTDYFDFFIRVRENGHDLGWRKSLDHIGSTGTDYLVKMLIYLSLIEVYRARAIDPKAGSTVHCILDETGVLAPKYIRAVLRIATERGIILITAGHSQETTGFEHTVHVRKHGQRFGAQEVLRKILRCD